VSGPRAVYGSARFAGPSVGCSECCCK
jgi:hypothetical protein